MTASAAYVSNSDVLVEKNNAPNKKSCGGINTIKPSEHIKNKSLESFDSTDNSTTLVQKNQEDVLNLGLGIVQTSFVENKETFNLVIPKKKYPGRPNSKELVFPWHDDIPMGDLVLEAHIVKRFESWVYPALSETAERVLNFVVRRTIFWKKTQEAIRKIQFIEGIQGVTKGCKLTSKASVNKGLKELLDMEFISVVGYTDKNVEIYRLNINKINDWVIKQESGFKVMLRPKKDKRKESKEDYQEFIESDDFEGSFDEPSLENKVHGVNHEGSPDEPLYKGTKLTEQNNKKEQVAIPAKADLADIPTKGFSKETLMDSISTKVEIKKKQKEYYPTKRELNSENPPKPPQTYNANTLYMLWESQFKETYPEAVFSKWSKKVFNQVKHFINTREFPEGQNVGDFTRFVITRWLSIKGQHFSYLNRHRSRESKDIIHFPDYPTMDFVMSYKNSFCNAYTNYKQGKLDELYYTKLDWRESGYSEEAIHELTIRKGLEIHCVKQEEEKLKRLQFNFEVQTKDLASKQKQLDREREFFGRLAKEYQEKINKLNEASKTSAVVQEETLHTFSNSYVTPEQYALQKEKREAANQVKPIETIQHSEDFNPYNLSKELVSLAKAWSQEDGLSWALDWIHLELSKNTVEEARKIIFKEEN